MWTEVKERAKRAGNGPHHPSFIHQPSVTVILCLPSPSVLHTAFGLVAAPGVSRHSTRLPTTHPVHPSARATRPLSSGPFATRNPAPGALLTTLPSVVGSEALRG